MGMGDGATTPSLVAFIFMKLHYPSPFPADNGPTFGSSEELEPRAKRMGRCDFLSSVLRVRSIEDLAAGRGKKLVDLRKVYYSA